METRQLFWSLGQAGHVLFYVVAIAAMAAFAWGFLRHILKYRRGAAVPFKLNFADGLRRMVVDVLSHRTLRRRDRYAGAAHAAIFFSFVLLLIGTATITLEYDITKPLFGVAFWHGRFYLVYSLVLDLAGLTLIAGLLLMAARRAWFRLEKLEYRRSYRGETEDRPAAAGWRREDWAFLAVLFLIAVTGFVQEAAGLLVDKPQWAAWSPVGLAVAHAMTALGADDATAAAIRKANWWIHGSLALAFIATIPWTKAKHMIAVLGSLAARDPLSLRRLPAIPESRPEPGISTIAGFSWKDMVNFDACTKCGRCHEACPARISGYPLSPRDLILDLRLHNDQAQGRPVEGIDLIGGVIDPEAIWSCRSCGACQEICPVGIQHPPIIVEMRRHLVDQGQMDPLLQSTLTAIANTGNSFGESSRKRPAWTRELEFRIKDLRRESAEYLWFVGDFASFDPRNQKVSRLVAKLLKAGRIDFGLLYEDEWTAGNDIRRVGEEGLYESVVRHNLEKMREARFSSIITTDPHSFNTIKNEYPTFGEVKPIRHYSSLLADMLADGRLKVVKPLGKRVTLHDPCHLGRLNGEFEAPRRVLELIGCELIEMPRSRGNSFCCGAGGGRIWIPDKPGTRKPSEMRMDEAAALDIEVFVTCCPKDMTMFEDARKSSGHENDLIVADLAELVAEAIDLKSIALADVPAIVDRISAVVADRMAAAIEARLTETMASRVAAAAVEHLEKALSAGLALRPADRAAPVGLPAPPGEPAEAAPPSLARDEPVRAAPRDWQPAPVTPLPLTGYAAPARTGRRILVAVKHVGKLAEEFAFAEDGRSISSEHLEFQLNEFDDTALEQALQIVEGLGEGEVVAVTVGPADAEATLRRALAKGAHRAVRIWHDDLGEADPVTVARLLAGLASVEQPDLVITGVMSADRANGATGMLLAGILDLPHAAVVVSTEWDGDDRLIVTRELEGGLRHKLRIGVPAVLSIQVGANTPRYATMRMIKEARSKPLAEVSCEPLDGASAGAVVRRMYVPPVRRAEMLAGDANEIAAAVARIVREKRGA